MNIVIIDYGSGNIKSVYNSIKYLSIDKKLKCKITITNSIEKIKYSDFIILPGVGSFNDCKENLFKIDGLVDQLYESVKLKQKPFLGICVGMQLLGDIGFENGETEGLKLIKGSVKKIKISKSKKKIYKIPHMGWNNLFFNNSENILDNISEKDYFYFVHSYYFDVVNKKDIVAYTKYSQKMPVIVKKENLLGFQFHPEKSGCSGQKVLLNWLTKS